MAWGSPPGPAFTGRPAAWEGYFSRSPSLKALPAFSPNLR